MSHWGVRAEEFTAWVWAESEEDVRGEIVASQQVTEFSLFLPVKPEAGVWTTTCKSKRK